MRTFPWRRCVLLWLLPVVGNLAWAHDPVFGLGPHVVYQGGIELALGFDADRAGKERERTSETELTYGVTGDWAAGIALPWRWYREDGSSVHGFGGLEVFTKYRFWRRDALGVQESAAVAVRLLTDLGESTPDRFPGSNATDTLLGLTYGYESRRWYRWAALRYRRNGTDANGVRRGDRLLVDLVGGIRPRLTGYLEPDSVWILELNGEFDRNAVRDGARLPNTGGSRWFLSPGIFWTYRNFAIKAGVQLPVSADLNGNQPRPNYRARLIFEWHE